MSEALQIQIHGSPALPTLIYLPGLHGNWKLIGGFRRALKEQVRFVEVTYPNTLSWSLDDHAIAVAEALRSHQIAAGWLLAESFGSQIGWRMLQSNRVHAQGVVLAGGFGRHPFVWGVRLAHRLFGDVPFAVLSRIFCGYAWITPFRFRRSPETFDEIREFIRGITVEDLQAMKYRLDLITQSDPCSIAREIQVPVHALSGLFDPVVPWFCVRPWLKKNCPALRDYKLIWRADHNVLGTAPDLAARQILQWMKAE